MPELDRRRESTMSDNLVHAENDDLYIGAAKRLGVESAWGGGEDFYVGTSPRNGFGASAEGPWCHWVHLARLILAHDLTREHMPEFHVEYDAPHVYSEHHPACLKADADD